MIGISPKWGKYVTKTHKAGIQFHYMKWKTNNTTPSEQIQKSKKPKKKPKRNRGQIDTHSTLKCKPLGTGTSTNGGWIKLVL